MPRGINNWTFNKVTRFLKDNGFRLNKVRGSHYFYIGNQTNILRQVCVPFHGAKAINIRTMNGIITQSGILKEKWLK